MKNIHEIAIFFHGRRSDCGSSFSVVTPPSRFKENGENNPSKIMHRLLFVRPLVCTAMVSVLLSAGASPLLFGEEPVNISSRVELFTDNYVIDQLSGDAKKILHKPEPKEVVFTTDAPWEGNSSIYYSIFQDGDTYRMYYRGSSTYATLAEHYASILGPDKKLLPADQKKPYAFPPSATCVAESRDGITWTRPDVGIFERDGSKKNNIVWQGSNATHNMAVFKDANPAAAPEARYKAIAGKGTPWTYTSPDGYHFTKAANTKVKLGTFDSQNLAFWDSANKQYRMYWRYLPPGKALGIRTATSKDFITWENEADLNYVDKPKPEDLEFTERVHLYTNAVQPYFNAPHILIGFPSRYIHKGGLSWPLLMTSRDGVNFTRWDEPLIPLDAPANRDTERANFMGWGMLQLPGKPDEISLYAGEAYRAYGPTRLRRFTYRLDGFVSVSAGPDGGEMVTKPLLFTGKDLVLNYHANPEGSVRVEILDANGKVLEGFSREDCEPLTGDSTKAAVKWKGQSDLTRAASKDGVRVKFVLKNADLYSLKM